MLPCQGEAKLALQKTALVLEVGAAEQLKAEGGTPVLWQLTAPKTAEVFENGWVVGLQPGEVRVRASVGGESAECVVKVEPAKLDLVDPAALKQFPDERRFESKGRRCYGSELNGQRASSPEERHFTRSNRVINPKPLRADKPLEWEVEENTEIYDGAGVLMGTVASKLNVGNRVVPVSKFNFGMSKVLNGRLCLYAFSVSLKPTAEVRAQADPSEMSEGAVGTSAWLPLDQVKDKGALLERIGLGKPKAIALPLETKSYRITGGNPKQYMTQYGEMSIVRDVGSGPVPSHYLKRPSGTINLIYSVPGFGLGGQGLDSFLVSDGLLFYPAKGAKLFVQPTYFPAKHPHAGKISPQTMTFIYGAVKTKGNEMVYGWMAKEALD
ncbi:MAG TPA: hypothetical protein VLT36_04265 [Candidatus Dormibacteraeota bacterium]|nr:hypothetical protein [Candidatus Dormibacteraeota bacterium]